MRREIAELLLVSFKERFFFVVGRMDDGYQVANDGGRFVWISVAWTLQTPKLAMVSYHTVPYKIQNIVKSKNHSSVVKVS